MTTDDEQWRKTRDEQHEAAGDGGRLVGKVVRWRGEIMASSGPIGVVIRTERYHGPGGGWCCVLDRGDPKVKPLVIAVEAVDDVNFPLAHLDRIGLLAIAMRDALVAAKMQGLVDSIDTMIAARDVDALRVFCRTTSGTILACGMLHAPVRTAYAPVVDAATKLSNAIWHCDRGLDLVILDG